MENGFTAAVCLTQEEIEQTIDNLEDNYFLYGASDCIGLDKVIAKLKIALEEVFGVTK